MKKNSYLHVIFFALLVQSCNTSNDKQPVPTVKANQFEHTIDGKETGLHILGNGDLQMAVTNFGGRIVSLQAPDREGKYADVVLGFKSIEDYLNANEPFHGAIIGRVANRIADGKFTLDSTEYKVPINNVTNHLHGGEGGFHNVVWDVEAVNDTSIVLNYLSEDGEMGYPGNLDVEVQYQLSPANELLISYRATTDKRTPVMLTNHAFFNLGGEASGTINDHILTIDADRFIVVDSTLIPTGEIAQVDGTVLDFRKPKSIWEDLSKEKENQHLKNAKGYDHNWPLNKEKPGKMSLAGSIEDPDSGRKLTVYTQEPVLLFYGGNFLDGTDVGKRGNPFEYREAFCLETQHYPDSPNHDNFPSVILEPGEEYQTSSIYRFGTVQ